MVGWRWLSTCCDGSSAKGRITQNLDAAGGAILEGVAKGKRDQETLTRRLEDDGAEKKAGWMAGLAPIFVSGKISYQISPRSKKRISRLGSRPHTGCPQAVMEAVGK